eukprot:gnl/Spiro4/9142_TR4813_c0_g1_i1.p1 gnl/Spiro4/9142_TR4813_c0_g1~~gnl/Spiro4/9142_TR4813_c0_g1_i1.p1  ORF type:complete len:480 (-),score=96.55 gnl/Spiro4/9142_TR4813_c0_g1_i1:89-1366(-)
MATMAGTQGCGGCGGAPPSIDLWDPSALDTDLWIRTGVAMGCRRFVLTAKHGCGFLAWNSSLPGYDYHAGKSKSGVDVVAAFVASAQKYKVGYGFYYSTVSNQMVNVCDGGAVHPAGPGQLNMTQDDYNDLVIAHLTELWARYGSLDEVWFDGGYQPALQNRLISLFSVLQPKVVAFQASRLHDSVIRWVGTESGLPPYPVWSTCDPDGYGEGSPDSNYWYPAEADFTLQNGDNWFYSPTVGVHPPAELRAMYETSVGHNTAVIMDLAPFPNGTLPDEQIAAATALGKFIHLCYDHPLVSTNGTASFKGLPYTLQLELPPGSPALDRVVVQEDQSFGQLIRNFTISVTTGGNTSILFSGSSVGNKFIYVVPAAERMTTSSTATTVVLTVTETLQQLAPRVRNFALFACDGVAAQIDKAWRNGNTK